MIAILRCLTSAAAIALTFAPAPILLADDDDWPGIGSALFRAGLVRPADLSPPGLGLFPGVAGADPLRAGLIEVRSSRIVVVRLEGALPSTQYKTYFCGFPVTIDRCQSLGSIQTDSDGDARAMLGFPLAGRHWSGIFLFTKTNLGQTTEYLSGFTFPPPVPPPVASVSIQLRGQVLSVDLGKSSFRLVGLAADIFVNSETEFKVVHKLSDLNAGMKVEVEGFTRPDGSILATEVKEDKSKGKGKDKD